ncbi:hypothetical protein FVEG_17491 [Fusarium verticillioides 7600]|uniref:Aminotransferase class I/classII large domain-containing protein n=1 Tax=Gibberella moniliformis (strain M3125 / FGSC 7600) TaxID=334819 RepID=W7N6H5_GIBM7|nr:hypothetical protein FVEG_17491 [Fusarium verticillioides 7600]EWG55289.1 hypothetical protein FVEG_17491 [Fusarium verticillioides 7600]
MSDLQRKRRHDGNAGAPFVSALSLSNGSPELECQKLVPLPASKVHIIWSFSKDFGSSGLRLKTAIARFHQWGAPFIYPQAGPYVTVKLVKDAETLEEENEGLERLKQAGVMVSRLRGFGGWKGFSGNLNYYGWVRMTVAVLKDRLLDALNRIADIMKYEEKEGNHSVVTQDECD